MRRRTLPSRTLLPLACLLPVLLASAPLAAQQAYKWKDAAGVTHFTSEPPPDRPYQAREVDHHQAAPAVAGGSDDAPAAQARKGEDPGCATARSNLALLRGKAPVMTDSDGDGKPDKLLSDADRAKQLHYAEVVIEAKCSGDAAPAPAAGAAEQPGEPEEQ